MRSTTSSTVSQRVTRGSSLIDASSRRRVSSSGCSRASCWSARITCITALMSARCVNACGKFPRCRPEVASISSANSPSGEANPSSRSHSARARAVSPISASALTSQNEQIANEPSSPTRPSSVSETR